MEVNTSFSDILDCSVTKPSDKKAECVLKHYAEGDDDTLELTATDVAMHSGKLKVLPILDTVGLGDSTSSLYDEYSTFVGEDQ